MTPAPTRPHRIGAIASASGLTPDAIRYYERLGLVPKAARTRGGFRLYPPDVVGRLRFIKQAQQLGLELKEIRDLLHPANGRQREQCRHVRGLLEKHVVHVEARIRDFEAFRVALRSALDQCNRALRMKETVSCPVLSDLRSRDS